MTAGACFEFRPRLRLRIVGDRRVLAHFAAEYGSATADDVAAPVEVEARYGDARSNGRAPDDLLLCGGHKTVRWEVALLRPGAGPLRTALRLSGYPRPFALSLTQGYVVEPLLSVAAAANGLVLLPSAGIGGESGVTVLLGRSGTGKSSLTARALAAGRPVLGDDQILIDASGRCWSFPRRMRFYSDLPLTAPSAYARLGRGARAALLARKGVRSATRGFVAPPIRVRPTDLGAAQPAGAFDVARVAVIERSSDAASLEIVSLSGAQAATHAVATLEEQRAKLDAPRGSAWHVRLDRARADERDVLSAFFEQVPVERIAVPRDWPAPRAIDALADALRIE